MAEGLNLQIVPGRYAIARLAPDAPIPDWADGAGFMAISRASDELTVICLQQRIPDGIETDRSWFCLRTIGPFGFGEAGIVHRLITPLSENGIGIFVVCTFDGEHLLLAEKDRLRATELLQTAGHRFC
jgi:uncharacterized protein